MGQTEEIASLTALAPMGLMRMSVKERFGGGEGLSSGIPQRVVLVRALMQPPLCKGPKHTGREMPDLH